MIHNSTIISNQILLCRHRTELPTLNEVWRELVIFLCPRKSLTTNHFPLPVSQTAAIERAGSQTEIGYLLNH
jgi:hypothetical protein